MGGILEFPWKVVLPVSALKFIIFDFFWDISNLWLKKKPRVIPIRVSRSLLDLPIKTRSSAKNIAEILSGPRSMPSPEELRSSPRLLINKQKSKGERLQPRDNGNYFNYLIIFYITLFYTLCKI